MYKSKRSRRSLFARLTSRPLLLIVALVLLGIGGVVYNQIRNAPSANKPLAEDIQSGEYINLNPPTEQEKRDAEENKKALAEDRPTPQPPTSNAKKQVAPEITFADRSEVRAYVPGIFEDGGTCTATATKGTQTQAKSSEGFKNVSDTQCAPIEWALSGNGWSVVVGYNSKTAQGKSEPIKVD